MSPMQPSQNSLAVSAAVMSNSSGPGVGVGAPPSNNSPPGILSPASALEHYRLSQLYQYAMAAERFRCPPGTGGGAAAAAAATAAAFFPGLRPELAPFLYSPYCRFDTRLALCRPPEEPKPQHSYIGLIAMAILSSPDKKLVLSDIYQYILDNYPYFRTRGPGWRNSIRHNLSLNDCFIKAGRSPNGKGHFWAIHPANMDDFTKGDFRRRKAQRKVRRHMGLAVDDEDSPSPPPSNSPPPPINWPDHLQHHQAGGHHLTPHFPMLTFPHITPHPSAAEFFTRRFPALHAAEHQQQQQNLNSIPLTAPILNNHRKRQFDVASLLAPEKFEKEEESKCQSRSSPSIKIKSNFPTSDEEADDEMESEQIDVDEDDKSACADAEDDQKPQLVKISSICEVPLSSDEEGSGSASSPAICQGHQNGGKIPALPMSNPLDFNQQQSAMAHAHSQAHQLPPGFHLSPSHLLHNPSLASLMILSSRYRELTSAAATQGNSGSNNVTTNNLKRHSQ